MKSLDLKEALTLRIENGERQTEDARAAGVTFSVYARALCAGSS